MIYSVPVSQTLRAYIIITYFDSKMSKETNISCKNVVNNLVLKYRLLHGKCARTVFTHKFSDTKTKSA